VADLVYNPYSFDTHDDPYVVYQRLRDEAPAYWNPELEFWALSRFDDVLEGFRDFETYSSAGGIALESRRPIGQTVAAQQMIEMDPPDHTALRKLVSRVFTGRRVAEMEDEIRRIVDRYIDTVAEQGHADVIADISSPFPMDVICAVLGVPAAHRDDLRRCSDMVMVREDGSMRIPEVAAKGMFGLLEYFIENPKPYTEKTAFSVARWEIEAWKKLVSGEVDFIDQNTSFVRLDPELFEQYFGFPLPPALKMP